jgi:hypothetical protein
MVMYVDQELWHVECVSKTGASASGDDEKPQRWDGTSDDAMGY